MKTIWKTAFDFDSDEVTVMLPVGAKVLAVHEQHGLPCVWFLVDTDAPKQDRTFWFVGTGQEIPEGASEYVGTVLLDGGRFVLHVFEHPSTAAARGEEYTP
jgi:hypothetical protein